MKLAKIVIEVSGKKIEFTPEEAKELKMILADMFGGEKTVYVNNYPNNWHWPWYWSGTTWCYNSGLLGSGITGNVMDQVANQGSLQSYATSGTNWSASLNNGTVTISSLS